MKRYTTRAYGSHPSHYQPRRNGAFVSTDRAATLFVKPPSSGDGAGRLTPPRPGRGWNVGFTATLRAMTRVAVARGERVIVTDDGQVQTQEHPTMRPSGYWQARAAQVADRPSRRS